MQELAEELSQIQSADQIQELQSRLKKLFNCLVDIMIAAHEYKEAHPVESVDESAFDWEASEQLRLQLVRIFKMERGQEGLEKVQQDALLRLDAYEKQVKKRRGTLKLP